MRIRAAWKALTILGAMAMSVAETEIRSSEGRTGPQDDRPLTQQEYQLLQRLLSDPFSFPIQYKTWLVSYLETSDLSLPMSSVQGLTQMLGIAGVSGGTLGIFPAGIILPYGGDGAPTGALMCDGALYAKTAQERLFAAIGTRYNLGGEAAGTFRTPDMQERIPVGRGTLGYLDTVGKSDGLAKGSRGVKHQHVVNQSPHVHGGSFMRSGWNGGFDIGSAGTTGGYMGMDAANANISVGPAGTPVDGPAFLTVNFIVTA